MTTLEYRAALEWRATGRKLEGIVAPFDSPTDLGGITEVIRRGAFAKTLAEHADVVALVDHSPDRLLGRTRSKTLRLSETPRGLGFELDLPETRDAEDLLALATRGDLGGMSFGFRVRKPSGERWTANTRELLDLDLREISVVQAWPAYADTSVAARSRAMADESRRQLAMMARYLETL